MEDNYKHKELSWDEFTNYLNGNPVHFCTHTYKGRDIIDNNGKKICLDIFVYYRNDEECMYKLYFAFGTYVGENSEIKSWMKYFYLCSYKNEDTVDLYNHILSEFFENENYTNVEIH